MSPFPQKFLKTVLKDQQKYYFLSNTSASISALFSYKNYFSISIFADIYLTLPLQRCLKFCSPGSNDSKQFGKVNKNTEILILFEASA